MGANKADVYNLVGVVDPHDMIQVADSLDGSGVIKNNLSVTLNYQDLIEEPG